MATKTKAPVKTTKASKKSLNSISQTHGALAPTFDLDEQLGIRSPYTAKDLKAYQSELAEMGTADLQGHAHQIGVVPMDSRERLVTALERKFIEHKTSRMPIKPVPVKINPEMESWHKRYQAGTL